MFLAQDRIIVARDPHGFRPLAMGRLVQPDGRIAYVFASETCAFDLINAVYINDVEPGEMVCVGPEGMTRERYTPARKRSQCVFEHVYFSRPDSIVFGRAVQESRENLGRLLARESPVDADVVVPVPDSGVAAALGLCDRIRHSVPPGADPQPLCGPHVHRAFAGHPRFRREAEAQSRSAICWKASA